jgi:hypothetical protein
MKWTEMGRLCSTHEEENYIGIYTYTILVVKPRGKTATGRLGG